MRNKNVYVVEDETRYLYFSKSCKITYNVELPPNGGTMRRVRGRIARIFLKLLYNFISLLYKELTLNLKHATSSVHMDGCYYDGCNVIRDLRTAVSFVSGRNLAISLF